MARSTLDIGSVSSVDDVEFMARLGAGLGAGRFKARLPDDDGLVSLLLEDAGRTDRRTFMDWGRALKRAEHPSLPAVVRVEEALRPSFVATRYVEGRTLGERLEGADGVLPEVQALGVILQASAGLRAAHQAKLAHGALSARSVVLAPRNGAMDSVTLVGWAPHADFDAAKAADVAALGRLLYEALTGAPPPSEQAEGEGAGGGRGFDGVLADLSDVRGALGKLALRGADGAYPEVDAFVDALLPHFSDQITEQLGIVEFELNTDREFRAEVERQRHRQRELESKLRFIRQWLREHAADIDRVDEKLTRLAAQGRSLQNLHVEVAMLLERPLPRLEPSTEARLPIDRQPSGSGSPIDQEPTAVAVPAPRRGPRPEPTPDAVPAPVRAPVESVAPAPDAEPATESAPEPSAPASAAPSAEPPEPSVPAAPRSSASTPLLVASAVIVLVAGAVWWWTSRSDAPADTPPVAAESAATAASAPATAASALAPAAGAAPSSASARPASAAPSAPASQVATAARAPDAGAPDAAAPDAGAPEAAAAALAPPPDGMVAVPAGAVQVGLSPAAQAKVAAQCATDAKGKQPLLRRHCGPAVLAREAAAAPVELPAFYIDKFEVSQAMWAACRKARRCGPMRLKWDLPEQPATGVSRKMAAGLCRWRGGRLPTATEWLRAARGDDARLYPWGDAAPVDGDTYKGNFGAPGKRSGIGPNRQDGHKYAGPVGIFSERGSSPFGLANLGGNVREWTSTTEGRQAVVAGGGWRDLPVDARVTRHERVKPTVAENDLGFRCLIETKRK